MARIPVVEPEDATGELKDVYARIVAARGRIGNVWKVESLNPGVMGAHLDLYMAIMYGKSGLTRRQREMIAMTVSGGNGCHYCTTHHAEALSAHLKDAALLHAIKTDYATAPIDRKERAMLDYAVKLAKTPATINDADVQKLRDAGLTDRDILDATLITSYFCFVNRVVLGTGVELEPGAERTYRY